jgi:hypothetical protein
VFHIVVYPDLYLNTLSRTSLTHILLDFPRLRILLPTDRTEWNTQVDYALPAVPVPREPEASQEKFG